jgi:hypothetical protein
MQPLDLNIDNYTQNDLEKFFKLPKNYNHNEVELMESKIREQLIQSGHVAKSMKRDLIVFLRNAKEKLVDFKQKIKTKIDLKHATMLPMNTRLDATEYNSNPNVSREQELNLRERTQFIHTQTSEFLPGKVNPIHTRVISKCLTIDTRFRSNYFSTQSSDFTFQMPVILNRVVSMQLSSFEIPVSFYGISNYNANNYLHIRINYNDLDNIPTEFSHTFTIPDGNYNAQALLDTINNLISSLDNPDKEQSIDLMKNIRFILGIDSSGGSGSGSGNGLVYVAYNKSTVTDGSLNFIKFDFRLNSDGNIDTVDYSKKIGWNLGFNKPNYTFTKNNSIEFPHYFTFTDQTDVPSNYNIYGISDMIIEPATIRYIYLAIDDFNSSVNDLFTTAFYTSIMSPDVIARISLKGSYFSLLMENDLNVVTEPRVYFGPVDIQKIRVRLYDDKGNILQMNNSNFSFCLVFKMLYDL